MTLTLQGGGGEGVGGTYLPNEWRKGGWRKKAKSHEVLAGAGANPGPTANLASFPSCTPQELFRQVSLFVAIDTS